VNRLAHDSADVKVDRLAREAVFGDLRGEKIPVLNEPFLIAAARGLYQPELCAAKRAADQSGFTRDVAGDST
jgi:hypothetical protein